MGDPNITDTCISFSPAPPASQYWLSEALIMTTTSDEGFVSTAPGVTNTTRLGIALKEDCLAEGVGILFDLFISTGDPSLPMYALTTGGASSSDTLYPLVLSNLVTQTATPTSFTWPSTVDFSKIGTGHRCLLARAYPSSEILDTGALEDLTTYPSDDPHYAQHNCYVGATDTEQVKVPIINGNWREEPIFVAVQAVPDLNPNRTVQNAVLSGLRLNPAFKQIATTPLSRVDFDFSAFKSPHESLLDKIEDWIEKEVLDLIEDLEGKCHKGHGASTRVALPPGLIAKFNFIADMSAAKPGDAHIYHISQVNGKGEPFGGLTVAILRT